MRNSRRGTWTLAAIVAPCLLAAEALSQHAGKPANRDEDSPGAPGRVEVLVFLKEQRLNLLIDGKLELCTPVSTGRQRGWTPVGTYSIIGKSKNHRSGTYGKFVAAGGRVIRSGVDSRKRKPPQGSRFVGAPMPNFLRMTENGIGIHCGELPGYPASKGCIRVPREASELLFSTCEIGTPVTVQEDATGAVAGHACDEAVR